MDHGIKRSTPGCAVPGCPGKHKGHGLCEMHLVRQRRNGHPGSAEKRKPRGICQASGCDEPHQARGFCDRHYRQALREDPEHIERRRRAEADPGTARVCSSCGRALTLRDFYRDKSGRGGYRSNCKDCQKADVMARWQADPEGHRARQAVHRATPERRQKDCESAARWRAEHPEQVRATLAAYRARPENRELARQRSRAWRIANPERKRELDRQRLARMRQFGGGGSIPAEMLATKLAYWGHRCWIAGPNCTVEPDQWDHVKPLSKGGAHLLANLRPACNPCNSSKKARWPFPLTYGPARLVIAC
jgi:5-methylcytosine-specific restriction endonuclease McrA